MPYITQTKRNIQSTNVNKNDILLYMRYTVLSIYVSIAWRAWIYRDV